MKDKKKGVKKRSSLLGSKRERVAELIVFPGWGCMLFSFIVLLFRLLDLSCSSFLPCFHLQIRKCHGYLIGVKTVTPPVAIHSLSEVGL